MTIGEFIRQQGNEALAYFAVRMMEAAEQKLLETNGLQECVEVIKSQERTAQNIEVVLKILNEPYQEEQP